MGVAVSMLISIQETCFHSIMTKIVNELNSACNCGNRQDTIEFILLGCLEVARSFETWKKERYRRGSFTSSHQQVILKREIKRA